SASIWVAGRMGDSARPYGIRLSPQPSPHPLLHVAPIACQYGDTAVSPVALRALLYCDRGGLCAATSRHGAERVCALFHARRLRLRGGSYLGLYQVQDVETAVSYSQETDVEHSPILLY